MKLFDTSFHIVLYRYYLQMVVVVVSFLIGLPWLAFLALPIFLSAFMDINFTSPYKNLARKGPVVRIQGMKECQKAA